MHSDSNPALVDRLARYDELVEVGVGRRHGVAAGLAARGRRVTATDVRDRELPPCVRFVRDDVTDPDPAVYRGADAVYALRCPPELQRPLAAVARTVGADCLFTTLGGDPTVVEASPETLPAAPAATARPPGGIAGSGAHRPTGGRPGSTLFTVQP